jgi:DNA-binding IclR family transcriptional regulator
MAVLEVFAREKRELSNSDMARFLDLPDSSCSDLLHTLHQGGYVLRTARTRRFYPTSRIYTMASEIIRNDPLYAAGSEALELLVARTGETAFSGRLDDGAVKIVASQEGRHPLRYVLASGERIALHASGLGKALLGLIGETDPAEASRQMRLKPLRQLTSHTLADIAALEADLAAGRARGWFLADEEGNDGVSALGVAGYIGEEALAISVGGPAERMRKNLDEYVSVLHEVADITFGQRKN